MLTFTSISDAGRIQKKLMLFGGHGVVRKSMTLHLYTFKVLPIEDNKFCRKESK